MAKVMVFDPAKLPTPPSTPSKWDDETLTAYASAISGGKAAGDGIDYADQKAAKSAAQSIKRGLRRFGFNQSTKMRLWNGGTAEAPAWHFALLANTTSNAPKAKEA